MVMKLKVQTQPRISVIIPCYNQSRYLSKAINSVIGQTYSNYEIIVVDDGSTDNCRKITDVFEAVRYFYQENAGLSAARNRGIQESTGQYLVFLDADDWLYPDALETNAAYLQVNGHLAFVSGSHNKVDSSNNVIECDRNIVLGNHFLHLLQGNYIGMHAAVMYNRWVFDKFKFDESIKMCEDYDLYLKISRTYPVVHHINCMAAYRIHDSNMSGDIPNMLRSVHLVLRRQKQLLRNDWEKECFRNGLAIWQSYYCNKIFGKFNSSRDSSLATSRDEFITLARYAPGYAAKILVSKLALLVSGYKSEFKKLFGSLGF